MLHVSSANEEIWKLLHNFRLKSNLESRLKIQPQACVLFHFVDEFMDKTLTQSTYIEGLKSPFFNNVPSMFLAFNIFKSVRGTFFYFKR